MSNHRGHVLPIKHRLLTELDARRLYTIIAETACAELGADAAALFLWSPGAQKLALMAQNGPSYQKPISTIAEHIERLALQVARSGQPVRTVAQEHHGAVAMLSVPLLRGERVLGALQVAHTDSTPSFNEDDQELLQQLADQAAVAIENAQMYGAAQQRIERLDALRRISTAIVSSLDLDAITSTTLQELVSTFPLEGAQLVLVRPNPALPMQRRAWRDNRLTPLEMTRRPASGSLLARVLHDGTPRIEHHHHQHHGSTSPVSGSQDVLAVALWDGRRACGAIELIGRLEHQFTDADIQFMIDVGVPLASAITNAQLHADTVASETRYRALLEYANDAIMLLDSKGQHVIDTNRSMELLTGYSRAALRLLLPESLFTTSWQALYNASLASNSDQQSSFEAQLCTHDQVDIPVSVGVSRVQYGSEELLLLIVRDIRGQQRLTQQMMQTEKLAAIGRLTSSIAHEVNNPLQAIYTSLDLLRKNGMSEEKRQRYLDLTFAEAERLITIVHRLIDFHRPSRDGMRPTQMLDLLDGVLTYLDDEIRQRHITVVKDWQAPQPRTMAIYSHLKQVCANLISNALDAMPEGGTLTMRVYQERDPQPSYQRERGPLGQGNESLLVIEFHDTGLGIAAHELHKIFEPFYTTKVTGTGLGLAVSYNIIQQHGGNLTAVSAPGEGATFIMRLPVVE